MKADTLDRVGLAIDLAQKKRLVRLIMSDETWDGHMAAVAPYIRRRMQETGGEALSCAIDIASQIQSDPACPPLLPLLFVFGAMEMKGEPA